MTAPLKIAFAGTGSIGQRHLRNLLATEPEAQLVFLRANARRDALSSEVGAQVVSDMAELLDCAPDGLIISTPSAFHGQTLFGAVEAGLPVYVEKPVVTSLADLAEVHRLTAQRPDLPTLVGCNLRFLPSLQKLHALVRTEIGMPARARFEAGQWLPDWRPSQDHRHSYSAAPQEGGGVILDLLHELDAAEWILGPLEVAAATTAQAPVLQIDSEAVANILLRRCDLPLLVSVELDYVARRPLRQYRVVGDGGTLTWSLADKLLRLETPIGTHDIDCGAEGFDVAKTYERAMAEFLTALRGGPQTSNPLQTGLSSNALALAAKELSC
tara:strand:- start:20730 stop:21710 length:981 start_codon:yes stop_codon:yes gene_type:complete